MTDFSGVEPTGWVDTLRQQAARGRLPNFIEREAARDLQLDQGESALGVVGGMGKGVADGTLALGRWLIGDTATELGSALTGREVKAPESLYDLLPDEPAARLSSRIAQAEVGGLRVGEAAETTGSILSLLGGNVMGVAGKGAGITEKAMRAAGLGDKALKGLSGIAQAGSLPGKTLSALEWPGKALGRKLVEKIPGLKNYTRTAKALPELMGSAGGFGLYGLATTGDINADGTTDMDDRIAAGLHGMMAGAALRVFGMAADKIESRLLDATLKGTPRFQTIKGLESLRRAEGMTWQQFSDMLGPRAVGTLAEAAGWALLDQRVTDALLSGDYERAMELYTHSIPGALLARTGRTDYWQSWRRAHPEQNTWDLRQSVLLTRDPDGSGREMVPVPPPQLPQGQKALPDAQQPSQTAVAKMAKPLLDAGWEIPAEGAAPAYDKVRIQYPGRGDVIISVDGSVSVSREVFRMVRGDDVSGDGGDGPIRMEGAVAEEFLGDLAAISQMRQMAGEIHLGGRELSAGGWFLQENGTVKKVGLDGKVYTSQLPMDPTAKLEGEPLPDVPPDLVPPTPEVARWLELAKAIRRTSKQTPGVDLIESAVITAMAGNPESASVQELVRFMQQNDPEVLASSLTPERLEQLGDALGRIGSGHATADNVAMFMRPPTWAKTQSKPEIDPMEPDAITSEIPNDVPLEEPPKPDRTGEEGFVDLSIVQDAAKGAAALAENVGTQAKIAADFVTQRRPEIIRKALPEDTIGAEIQRVNARRRQMRGEATARFKPAHDVADSAKWRRQTEPLKPKEKQQWQLVDPAVEGVEIARWELVADRKLAPDKLTQTDKAFQDSTQDTLRYLWTGKQDVGGWQGSGKDARLLSSRESQVVPRLEGKDAATVMADPDLRKAWFKVLENLNPDGATAAAREAEYASMTGKQVTSQDRRSALEYIRADKVVPHVVEMKGKRYVMREMDPRQVMLTAIRTQSGEIAATGEWGQEGADSARATLQRQLNEMPDGPRKQAVLRNLELGGIGARLQRVGMALDRIRMHPSRKRFVARMTEQAMVLAQGGSIDEPTMTASILRWFRGKDALARAVMTMRAPALDAPEFLLLPLMFGGRHGLKAFRKLVGRDREMSLGEAVEHYTRLGVISSRMGQMLYEEATGFAKRATAIAGSVGEWTERRKAALVAVVSDVMLDAFRKGHVQPADIRQMANLRMPADAIARLSSGKFTAEDANLFRIEFVKRATRRAEQGEGVPAADNLLLSTTVRFMRLISEQMALVRQPLDDAYKAFREGRKADAFRHMGQAAGYTFGFAVSDLFGAGVFAMLLSSAFRGSFDDVEDRLEQEFTTADAWRHHFARALVGGPLEAAANLIVEPTMRSAMGATAPTDWIRALRDIYQSLQNGVGIHDALEAMNSLHLIPFGSDIIRRGWPRLREQAIAYFAGTAVSLKTDYIQDQDDVSRYLRGPGLERNALNLPVARPDFVPSKSQAFYDAVHTAMDEWMRAEADQPGSGMDAAYASLEKAINQEDSSPRSVASWIRSQQALSRIPRSQHSEFLDFIGMDRFASILSNDRALSELAKYVGRMEGELPPDWEGRLDEMRTVIAAGGGDYRAFVDEAVEYTARSIKVGGRDWSYIDDIAQIIASNKDVFTDVFRSEAAPVVWPRGNDMRVRWARGELVRRAAQRAGRKIQYDREEQRRRRD